MQKLNFPAYSFRFKNSENKVAIFDEILKKFILLIEKKYPKSYINVEKIIKINGLTKRYDVVVFKPNGEIFLLVECKAPGVMVSQITFDQIARYNMTLNASYMMVTNGLNHYFCRMDYEQEKYNFLKTLPEFTSLQ